MGGKGENLSLLVRSGFPVPSGFLITTAAYRTFVQANNLHKQIIALANDKTVVSERRSAAIRQLFEKGRIPTDVAAAINYTYTNLVEEEGDLPLAVRSSATAEDLPGASFAGQQESYLNVHGKSELLDAVQRCWSSLWTTRALDYRSRQGIDSSDVSLAIVVQVMVPAEASGIMFTANPMNGARNEIVVDAAWGLGEAIVGGLVTPDHIVLDKATAAIKDITVADKMLMTQPAATGTEERDVQENKRRAQVLEAAQATELAKLGAEIEKYYGQPQDIEWCLDKGKFFIVQTRPITTLPLGPVRWESPIPGSKWMKDVQTAEWVKEPPSPLAVTSTLSTMVTAREHMRTWLPVPKHYAPWFTLINGWFYQRSDHKVLGAIGFMMWTKLGLLIGPMNGHNRAKRRWPARITTLSILERTELTTLSDGDLRTHVGDLLKELGWWWVEVSWLNALVRIGAMVLSGMNIPGLDEPAVLFTGNDSLLLQAERALLQAADDQDKVAEYLMRFGHFSESVDPIDLTLRESPEHLAWQLAAIRQSDSDPDVRLSRARKQRQSAEAAVRALKGFGGWVARNALITGQSHAAHTDDAVFHFQRVISALRAAFLEVGRRFTLKGKLAHLDDVFYLEYDELWRTTGESAKTLAVKVIERRALREQRKRLSPPLFVPPISDPVWTKDPLLKMMPPAMYATMFQRGVQERGGKRVLVASPSSPGRARGTARVILGPKDFSRFEKGDVLVTRTTSPIWTPLLGIAAAVVTETGGPVAHAAIVAREFGIPLVDGAIDATRVISDGAPIVVDGSTGIVEM